MSNPKIPICFSPNQGGHHHADLTNANDINENDLVMEQDNETEVSYQEQINSEAPKSNKFLYWGLGIVGVLVIAIISTHLVIKKKKSN